MELEESFFEVGSRIRELRGSLGQSEFAERLGVDRKSVAGWEAGKRLPDGKSLLALMRVFGGSASYLLTGNEGGAQLADAAEQVLIDSYRRCNAEARRHLIQTAALLSAGTPSEQLARPAAAGRSVTQTISAPISGNVAAGSITTHNAPARRNKK